MTVDWGRVDLSVLVDLPARLDDRQLEAVTYIATLPAPVLPPAPEQHFLQCMRTLRLLPKRGDDDLSGELRLALYRKHFGRYPAEALSFLVERATLTCRFFPTPQECKAILDQWNRTDGPWRAHQLAKVRARQEWEARFDDVMRRFQLGEVTQAEADAMPERWRRIAATRGFLREDGTYAVRQVRRACVHDWGGPPSLGAECLLCGEQCVDRVNADGSPLDEDGEAPADLDEQHTGPEEKAGQPHERTGQ